jgi:hypothetical protein
MWCAVMHHTVLSSKEQSAKIESRTEPFTDFFDDSSMRYQTMYTEMQHVAKCSGHRNATKILCCTGMLCTTKI